MDAARQVGDSGMLASTQINLAGLMKERGDLASSIEFLEGAVDAARRAGRHTSLRQALLNLANTDLYMGRLERARSQIVQLGDPALLPSALRAQLHGLRAELSARSGKVEESLVEYTLCEESWKELGRLSDASEAALEAVLVAADVPKRAERGTGTFVPTVESLRERIERGRAYLKGEETALLALADARTAYFAGEPEKAEVEATRAFDLATRAGHREWAWRASALRALVLESAGKRSRAARARREAVEILEDIGAHLPPDLRTVYWSEGRRRGLRAMTLGEEGASVAPQGSPDTTTTNTGFSRTGTELVSRLSMTPLERRLARVLAINSDLAGEVDLSRLATKIIAHACELLSAERGYLLLGTSADLLTVCASRGGQGVDHQEFSRSIAAEVLSSGAPLVSVDAGRDQRLQAYESVHLTQVAAVACVPVLSPQGSPIGALYVETRTGVRPGFGEEVPTLQAFADQAAIAIENSRLISELREKSTALEERNRHLKEARARLKEILGKRTARLREVKKELIDAKSQLANHASYGGMVGTSGGMRRVYSLIERVKDTDIPVLITGESGTGKEIAARAIYEGSSREKGRMLAVNCGAIPETLLESELFGCVRGAFTGADRDRKGLFREADGGVLFLDEIGETPLKMQATLLRVLQEKKVRPVGGAAEIPIDVRVIFATNRDLKQAVAEGKFREDLLYRIQVVELALPPLHQRTEDIPLLCDHFLSRFALRFDQQKKSLSRAAMGLLLEYPFPGNIRQLENVLLNAWIMSDEETIEAEDLQLPEATPSLRPLEPSRATPQPSAPGGDSRTSSHTSSHTSSRARSAPLTKKSEKKGTLSEHQRGERRQIVDALQATGWNRLQAAAIMNMPRRTFYRRLREYDIQ
jgi:serine/threonine-protein kinase PknK